MIYVPIPGNCNVYVPSGAVTAPIPAPLIAMVDPGSGSPFTSVTRPLT